MRRRILPLKTGRRTRRAFDSTWPGGSACTFCAVTVCRSKASITTIRIRLSKQPQAGFLMKVAEDGQQNSIIAHGFRNAYDFAFNQQGQIFTFDSDGERDVSLPWYRPTRVFQLKPGDHAGFLYRLVGNARATISICLWKLAHWVEAVQPVWFVIPADQFPHGIPKLDSGGRLDIRPDRPVFNMTRKKNLTTAVRSSPLPMASLGLP